MALRDQPYLPLYVNDFLTDEKLNMCSAESTGVYIRLLCVMHKSKEYGKILLRQKYRQSEQQVSNFAAMLAVQMPYDFAVIERSISELVDEEVLYIDGDALCQKRMIKDAKLSDIRAKSGKKGAESSNKRFQKDEHFAAAKQTANTENEIEYENEDVIEDIRDKKEERSKRGSNKTDVLSESSESIYIPFSGELREAFDDWLDYKREKRQAYKPKGLKSLITQVQRYAGQFGESETANAIRNSMASNYQGIVFPKEHGGAAPQRDRQQVKPQGGYRGKDFFDDD